MTAALDLVSSETRRELLLLVKRRGGLTVSEAVEALDLARSTVREHLHRLREKGLLERTAERSGRGRPRHRYEMSEQAPALFPSRDGELMAKLVRFLREQDAEHLVEAFFEAYWTERTEAVQRELRTVDAESLDEKLQVLHRILGEEGFMPSIDEEEGTVKIRECNCPFPASINETQIPCCLEKSFFERIFGSPVERVSYIPDGHRACTYELVRGKDAPAGKNGG